MVFYSETGERSTLHAIDGQALLFSNEMLKVAYRVVPEVTGPDSVRYRVFHQDAPDSAPPLDVIEARADGQIHQGLRTAFKLAVTTLEEKSVEQPAPSSDSAVTEKGRCCIRCGGWNICCNSSRGNCCTVATSCGYGCHVCN
ncbi:MAG: hypothetical protein EOO71_00990 [Myxococcaceae bacterium]|nr:MAG: hypothetical protein EOO71_00990 [Myxococcaceae bacterium]